MFGGEGTTVAPISEDNINNINSDADTYLNARAEVSRVIRVVVVVLADALAELSRQPLLSLCTQLKQFIMVRVLISPHYYYVLLHKTQC